jgi:hypothetical protein
MCRVLPPSEPPDGERPRCLALAVVGRSATSWRLVPFSHRSGSRIFVVQPGCIPSPMVTQDGDHQFDGGEKQAGLRPLPRPQLQGFSSSGLRRRSAPSGGLLPRGSVTLFFPRRLGEKGILQPRGGFLQPCWGRRTAAAQPGCNIPSSVQAMVAPRTGRPRPGLPRADSRARGLPSTSCAVRAVLMFWSGLGEGGSEDLPVRFGAAGARWCGVEVVAAGEGFSADEIANSACTLGPPSPWLEWLVLVLRGREPFRRSVCPEVIAAAVLPPGMEVVVAAIGAGGAEPLGVRRPAGLLVWRLFIPAGTEPEFRL